LETGRTHQNRVHLQSIGFPLVGDAVYGKQHLVGVFPRQALHAERLALQHPANRRENYEWTAALPADMSELLARAGIDISIA
jgi:23S rRNA pseudouridine1911/1915/1917 synthase